MTRATCAPRKVCNKSSAEFDLTGWKSSGAQDSGKFQQENIKFSTVPDGGID